MYGRCTMPSATVRPRCAFDRLRRKSSNAFRCEAIDGSGVWAPGWVVALDDEPPRPNNSAISNSSSSSSSSAKGSKATAAVPGSCSSSSSANGSKGRPEWQLPLPLREHPPGAPACTGDAGLAGHARSTGFRRSSVIHLAFWSSFRCGGDSKYVFVVAVLWRWLCTAWQEGAEPSVVEGLPGAVARHTLQGRVDLAN